MRDRGPGALRVGWVLLALGYAASRLYALGLLPIFLDETVHLRWALSVAEGERIFRPWDDGRLLTIWLDSLVVPFVRDPLWAARAISVAFGAVTLWGTVEIGGALFSQRVGLLAGLFEVLCPFTLFYDRMALTDAALAAFATLTLLASVALVRQGSLRLAAGLGLLMALGVLTKFSGVLILLIPVAAALTLPERRGALLRPLAAAYAVALLVLAYPVWRITRSSVAAVVVAQAAEAGFWADLATNLRSQGSCLYAYWTPPLCALAAWGALRAAWRRSREGLLLVLVTGAGLLAVAASLRAWYPRYLLWETVPALLLAAEAAGAILERAGRALPHAATRAIPASLALALVLAPALRLDAFLWLDPPRAALPGPEISQYVDGWPSGYGVVDAVAFFRRELERHPEGVTVVTHSRGHRTIWFALDLAFQDEPRLLNEGLDLGDPAAVPWIAGAWAAQRPTYVVVSPQAGGALKRSASQVALDRLAARVATFYKPDGAIAAEIYAVRPSPGPGGGP